MSKPEQAVILCGGRGRRLMPHTKTIPKPMILCNNKPFLWYLLYQLHEQGISHFVLLTGYLGEKIRSYFGDGSSWNWQIEYSAGPVEWDTGKRLWESKELLDKNFLLLYSDNFIVFSLDELYEMFKNSNKAITFIVTPKKPGNIALDGSGIVLQYNHERSSSFSNLVELGYMIIDRDETFKYCDSSNSSFSQVLEVMASNQEISSLIHPGPYHSISDPKRWKLTEKYLKNNKIILIDRDGVINKKALKGEYILTWKDFEWIQETRDALIILANKGFQFIVLTNQAGIARGILDQVELDKIHHNMKDELLQDGIEILDVYVCPHHWDDDCICRKPKPGMLYQASKDWLFRLDKTFFIGDDSRDCQAAYSGGCKSIFIGENSELSHLSPNEMPSYRFINLIEGIKTISSYY